MRAEGGVGLVHILYGSTSTRLRTYTGESLEVLGIAVMDVMYSISRLS